MNKKDFLRDLGRLCRNARQRRNETLKDIAEDVGMSIPTICRFEKGERDSLLLFSVYGLKFTHDDWRDLNGIYQRYFEK